MLAGVEVKLMLSETRAGKAEVINHCSMAEGNGGKLGKIGYLSSS